MLISFETIITVILILLSKTALDILNFTHLVERNSEQVTERRFAKNSVILCYFSEFGCKHNSNCQVLHGPLLDI